MFVAKDADGNHVAVEFDEHDGLSAFGSLDGEVGGLISHDDIEYAAEALEPNSSAALLIWEDTWAKPLVDAMRASAVCCSKAPASRTISSSRARGPAVRRLTFPTTNGDD